MAQEVSILFVEDDPSDRFFIERAIGKAALPVRIHFVPHGQEAMEYLEGANSFGNREVFPFPSLLVTDLSMPVVNGFELLEWVRKHPHLKNLPALVLSGSTLTQDLERALALGAKAYFTKELLMNSPDQLMRAILGFVPKNS